MSFSRCLIFKVLCAVLVDSFSSLTHSFEFVNPFLQEFFPFSFRLFFLPAASQKQKRFLSYHTSHLLSRTFFILFRLRENLRFRFSAFPRLFSRLDYLITFFSLCQLLFLSFFFLFLKIINKIVTPSIHSPYITIKISHFGHLIPFPKNL